MASKSNFYYFKPSRICSRHLTSVPLLSDTVSIVCDLSCRNLFWISSFLFLQGLQTCLVALLSRYANSTRGLFHVYQTSTLLASLYTKRKLIKHLFSYDARQTMQLILNKYIIMKLTGNRCLLLQRKIWIEKPTN